MKNPQNLVQKGTKISHKKTANYLQQNYLFFLKQNYLFFSSEIIYFFSNKIIYFFSSEIIFFLKRNYLFFSRKIISVVITHFYSFHYLYSSVLGCFLKSSGESFLVFGLIYTFCFSFILFMYFISVMLCSMHLSIILKKNTTRSYLFAHVFVFNA